MTGPTAGLVVTAFPVPGENFRARDGKVRGVTAVEIHERTVTVIYLDGHEEDYPPTTVQEINTTAAQRSYKPR